MSTNKNPTDAQLAAALWAVENPTNTGYNAKTKKYGKFPDPNGIDWLIGPGLKVGDTVEDREYTKAELDKIAAAYSRKSLESIGKSYNEVYGTKDFPTPFDTVSVAPKMLMNDVRFRVGRLPQSGYPKLYQAIADGDWAKAIQESRTKFQRNGVWLPDNDRVRRVAETYFPGMFNVSYKPGSWDPVTVRPKKRFGGTENKLYSLENLNSSARFNYRTGTVEKPKQKEPNYQNAKDQVIDEAIYRTSQNRGGSLGYGLSRNEQAELANKQLQQELNNIHSNYPYIGGSTDEAREKYLALHPELVDIINKKSKIYGLGNVLRNRVKKEGYVDVKINDNNYKNRITKSSNNLLDNLNNIIHYEKLLKYPDYANSGFLNFGLDDAADYINSGKAVLKDNEQWYSSSNINERGREVNSADGNTIKDNIGIMASILSYMKELAKKRNPGISDNDADKLAGEMYNYGTNHPRFNNAFGGHISLEFVR